MSSKRPKSRKEEAREHYPKKDAQKTGFIIMVGALIMIVGHLGFWELEKAFDKDNYAQNAKQQSEQVIDAFEEQIESFIDIPKNAPDTMGPPNPYTPAQQEILRIEQQAEMIKKIAREKSLQLWSEYYEAESQRNNAVTDFKGQKKIVIIIDDMGVSRKLSEEVINLPGPLTLAFLPYADNLPDITKRAKDLGHELMIHMPMEPMNGDLDVGSIALLDDMSEQEIADNLEKAFQSFEGYVGINNHMGSRVTQNQKIMDQVMDTLHKRDLLFVDSITIGSSVAADTAARHGLKYAERDVFLDHHEDDAFVTQSLKRLEEISKKRGYAIAIGHPKKLTIKNLKVWLPKIKEKGFEIVPITHVVRKEAPKALVINY